MSRGKKDGASNSSQTTLSSQNHVSPAVRVFGGGVSQRTVSRNRTHNAEMEPPATPTPILGGSNHGADTPATAASAPAPPFPSRTHLCRRLLEAAELLEMPLVRAGRPPAVRPYTSAGSGRRLGSPPRRPPNVAEVYADS